MILQSTLIERAVVSFLSAVEQPDPTSFLVFLSSVAEFCPEINRMMAALYEIERSLKGSLGPDGRAMLVSRTKLEGFARILLRVHYVHLQGPANGTAPAACNEGNGAVESIFEKLRAAPHLRIGPPSASGLRVYWSGIEFGAAEVGLQLQSWWIQRDFESFVHEHFQVTGRWDSVLEALDLGGPGLDLFWETHDRFRAQCLTREPA